MKPHRVKLSRRKGWRMPANTVKVDRATVYGNNLLTAEERRLVPVAIQASVYNAWLRHSAPRQFRRMVVEKLRGKNLACWCKVFKCRKCGAEFDDTDRIRAGQRCPKVTRASEYTAWRCGGKIERVACHADHLLNFANSTHPRI